MSSTRKTTWSSPTSENGGFDCGGHAHIPSTTTVFDDAIDIMPAFPDHRQRDIKDDDKPDIGDPAMPIEDASR